jgi:hypothetical protein
VATPLAVTLKTLRVHITRSDGTTPALGVVTISSTYALRDTSNAVVHGPVFERLVLDEDAAGVATVQLPASDDPALTPSGWTYTVSVDTDAWRQVMAIEVPIATSGTLQLAAVAPAVGAPAVVTYALASDVTTRLALKADLVDGTVPYAQLPTDLRPVTTTDLTAWLTTYTAGITSSQPYREPTTQEAADAVLGIERLALGADATTLLTPLGYTITTGVDSVSGRPYALAVNESGTARAWGAFLVDLSRPIGLTIQCPHPVSDQSSELIGLAHWQHTPGALLVIAGAHRDATGTLQGGYPLADPGKQSASLFHQVLAAYMARGVPGVQWHGFADASAPGLTHVVATGSGNAGISPRRIAEEISDAGFTPGRGWDSSGSGTGLIGLTNVQGDASHVLGVPWTHIEVNATTRASSTLRARTAAAVVAAQPEAHGLPLMLATATSGQFPVSVGSANTTGTSPFAAHADHRHAERQSTTDDLAAVKARVLPNVSGSLLGATFDPMLATSSTATGVTWTAGVVYLTRVYIPAGTVTNLHVGIGTAGAGLTAGCFAGLYDTTGALLGQTASQATAWTSTGNAAMALTAPLVLTAGYYYVAVLANGTTLPMLARSPVVIGSAMYTGLSTGGHRQMTVLTGQTTLPASITMSNATGSPWLIWVGLT